MTANAGRDRDHAPDAGAARASNDGVELVGKIGKVEMAVAVNEHVFAAWLLRRTCRRLDVTRKNRRRCRQCGARGEAMFTVEERKVPFRHGHRQEIKQFRRGGRHERLRQDRDLPQHFGGHVEHGALPHRIGLGQRPRRFAGEIAVGVCHDRPHRIEHLM